MFQKDNQLSCLTRPLSLVFLIVVLITVLARNSAPENSTSGDDVSDEKIFMLVCHDRKPCEIIKKQDAGVDALGNTLKVITVSLRPKDLREEQADCLGELEPLEYWLMVNRGSQIASSQLLLIVCNDGYGAAGVGEDEITIDNNRFEHNQSGGSSWRWSTKTRLQLSPLRITYEVTEGFWTMGCNTETESWNWEDFSGYKRWKSPVCGPAGQPVEDNIKDTLECEYNLIPKVALDQSFVDRGWRTTGLGKCSVLVSGLEGHGYTIHGAPSSPDDAFMKIVLSANNELFVEVFDDRWVGPGKKWVTDDHLELWLGGKLPSSSEHCIEAKKLLRPQQWGIRVSDGKVFPAYGNPKSILQVEYDATPLPNKRASVRFKIKLPADTKSLTVVYSDSDDDKTEKRLIATSKLVYGSALTLGEPREIKPEEATCEVRDGLLEPRLILRQFDPMQAVLEK